MIIDGRVIAREITDELQIEVNELKARDKIPTISIITLGNEASWKTYVGQKLKLAEKLGIQTKLLTIEDQNEQELIHVIQQCNNDNNIHGIIVQRPFSKEISKEKVIDAIARQKDIDGFRSDSPYKVPVWLAVEHILKYIFSCHSGDASLHLELVSGSTGIPNPRSNQDKQVRNDVVQDDSANFIAWFASKRIAVIGQGETAGAPIARELEILGVAPRIYNSNSSKMSLNEVDIIISCVGIRVVEAKNLKPGVILIGVGIHKENDGKVHGDYTDSEIENIASFYTPTPGGVGPVNLAYLFKNLLEAVNA